MEDSSLERALERSEAAIARIEKALAGRPTAPARDEELRAKVRDAVAELDQLIREAAH